MPRLIVPILLLIIAGPTPGSAEPPRRHAAHLHSEARAFLAQDGNRIELQLQAPGANFAGFEHPPRTPAQRTTLDAALETLRAGDWLRTSAGADCSIEELRVEAPGFDIEANGNEHHDHDHDHDHDHNHDPGHKQDSVHGHDHEHENEHSESGHAEFHVTVKLDCTRPDRLDWIEMNLFDDWPDNRRIQADVLTETLQQRVELQPGRTRIDLR